VLGDKYLLKTRWFAYIFHKRYVKHGQGKIQAYHEETN